VSIAGAGVGIGTVFGSSPSAQVACFIIKSYYYTNIRKIKILTTLKAFYSSSNLIVPAKIYTNADIMKIQILNDNKKKAGIYRWVNISNGKFYIGRSIHLQDRLRKYYEFSYLTHPKKGNSLICRALLKYGYSSFSLEILEYCDKDKIISREQFYLDLFNPVYNILKDAGSSLGFKHSEETKKKISKFHKANTHNNIFSKKGEEAVNFGRTHTKETKLNMSLSRRGENNPSFGSGTSVFIYHFSTGYFIDSFSSIGKAAESLNVGFATLKSCIQEKILLYEKWLISSKPINLIEWNSTIIEFQISKKKKLKKGNKVYIYDIANPLIPIKEYDSVRECARQENLGRDLIKGRLNSGKSYLNKFIFSYSSNGISSD